MKNGTTLIYCSWLHWSDVHTLYHCGIFILVTVFATIPVVLPMPGAVWQFILKLRVSNGMSKT